MKKLLAIATILIAFTWTLTAMESEIYKVDPSQSSMQWKGEKVSGEHFGTVKLKSGEISVVGNKISQGEFYADMTSITVDDLKGEWGDKLLGHLKSDDFFSVAKHKDSKFEIISVKELENNRIKVAGKLTIKGITKVVAFEADYRLEGDKLIANAQLVVDRTKYNMNFRSGNFFEDLGDNLIYDDFTVDLKIVATKKSKS